MKEEQYKFNQENNNTVTSSRDLLSMSGRYNEERDHRFQFRVNENRSLEHGQQGSSSTSSGDLPSMSGRQNEDRDHRIQFRVNENRSLEQEQQGSSSTRRSISAGAVLCSNAQQLFPTENINNPIPTRSLGYFGTNTFVPYSRAPYIQNLGNHFTPPQFNHSVPTVQQTPFQRSDVFNQSQPSEEHVVWLGQTLHLMPTGIRATMHGFLSIQLRNDVRVDITIDQAIRIICNTRGIIVCLSSDGTTSSMIHPSGILYQYGSRVEVTTKFPNGNPKYAKMWFKGVSFTSEHSALTYLVDSAGARTTTDSFSDTHGDISLPIFLDNSLHGPGFIPECIRQLNQVDFWVSNDGIQNWVVNGIRISQTLDGLVRVGRGPGKYVLRVSPVNQTVSLTTPYVHATASVGNGRDCHVFVKRGERRMHYDGNTFIVRNGTHSAGFDEKGQLKVY